MQEFDKRCSQKKPTLTEFHVVKSKPLVRKVTPELIWWGFHFNQPSSYDPETQEKSSPTQSPPTPTPTLVLLTICTFQIKGIRGLWAFVNKIPCPECPSVSVRTDPLIAVPPTEILWLSKRKKKKRFISTYCSHSRTLTDGSFILTYVSLVSSAVKRENDKSHAGIWNFCLEVTLIHPFHISLAQV